MPAGSEDPKTTKRYALASITCPARVLINLAFILYRQHHQANVVARNPGLANPEISKIIGEQWQNETTEQKNKWKALAEEEKLRHQQQYPTYRYQPKRNGRRNSLDGSASGSEKPKCQKCSGRMILTPSAPYLNTQSNSLPATPGSTITPLTRTLPILRDLTLQSPAARQLRGSQTTNAMAANHRGSLTEERDNVGPLSPETKRRRFNDEQPSTVQRVMPPRYSAAPPRVAFGPGTPFPFTQPPPPAHAYPPAVAAPRRESLPGIRGVVSPPGPLAPPPRPGMGYQQHRLSQGHIPQDRSLTLPPLQTRNASITENTPGSGKTADEQIMNISFRYKIKVLSQVAPPATKTKSAPRGPLIAVEGDNAETVAELAAWLKDRLDKGEDLVVSLAEGPKVATSSGKEEAMAQYHRLAAEWLEKNKEILDSITIKQAVEEGADASMSDAVSVDAPPQSGRKIDKNYDDSDNGSPSSRANEPNEHHDSKTDDNPSRTNSNSSEPQTTDKMEVDKRTSTSSSYTTPTAAKPVTIIPNYSLYTSNLFARLIPIGPSDPYAPNDHWQWTATLWRGIIGPDLTIYLRDAAAGATTGPSVELEVVEGKPEVGLFVVKRVKGDGSAEGNGSEEGEVEASVLRRVEFEVSEWVRAFSGKKA